MKPPNQAVRTPGTNQPETLPPADRWLVKGEVLDMLCISDRTLQHWRSDGIIPYSRIEVAYFSENTIVGRNSTVDNPY